MKEEKNPYDKDFCRLDVDRCGGWYMSTDWLEIYRDYSGEELDAEITRMKQEATVYLSQNIADKSYQKSLDEVRNRLHAAIRVRNERRNRDMPNWGVPDFSAGIH